jgi:hypothetical protein
MTFGLVTFTSHETPFLQNTRHGYPCETSQSLIKQMRQFSIDSALEVQILLGVIFCLFFLGFGMICVCGMWRVCYCWGIGGVYVRCIACFCS